MVETSICIDPAVKDKLQKALKKLNISLHDMLSILLIKSRRLFDDSAIINQTVKYQKHDNNVVLVTMNIRLYPFDYEYAAGKRLVFKTSVSRIITMAIIRFLDEILNNLTGSENPDKKHFICGNRTYSVNHINENNEQESWKINWDLSPP